MLSKGKQAVTHMFIAFLMYSWHGSHLRVINNLQAEMGNEQETC
jgi:hypothetical protein